MRCVVVIPSRLGSSRLPAKPLLNRTGKYLVQHVFERAIQSKVAEEVIIATDDHQIFKACIGFGARAEMTRFDHASGTDRVAEIASRVQGDLFLNLQGDEPLVDPESVDTLFNLLIDHPSVPMATLGTPLISLDEYFSTSVVKVVRDDNQKALYFSRSPIPHVRDGSPDLISNGRNFLRHLGIYCYRRDFLLSLRSIPVHPFEQIEKLEQLRVLGHGFSILVGLVHARGFGIDTPQDYEKFVDLMSKKQ